MPQQSKQIDKYSLHRSTHYSGNVFAVIWLYSGEWPFARLQFLGDNFKHPVTTTQSGSATIIQVIYPLVALADIVDILRNEKPVSLTYALESGYARVESGKEPAGEE